jgi:hypothetical protein
VEKEREKENMEQNSENDSNPLLESQESVIVSENHHDSTVIEEDNNEESNKSYNHQILNADHENLDENQEDNNDDEESDDTLSKLDMNDDTSPEKDLDYQNVITQVQIEEKKVMNDYNRNKFAIPSKTKKGRSNLANDSECLLFLQKKYSTVGKLNFVEYLQQRRTNKQSIESSLVHCSQFVSYAKMADKSLKNCKQGIINLLTTICRQSPTLTHQYFDYLYSNDLQPSTIMARVDSIAILYEWIRMNSNDMTSFKDVSDTLPSLHDLLLFLLFLLL